MEVYPRPTAPTWPLVAGRPLPAVPPANTEQGENLPSVPWKNIAMGGTEMIGVLSNRPIPPRRVATLVKPSGWSPMSEFGQRLRIPYGTFSGKLQAE